jgi:ribosomal protein S18 acetylase RimI-like enzyme
MAHIPPFTMRPLQVRDAAAAARIHAEGQPGTFLTALGPSFLRGLYGQMAVSSYCYGYVACEGDSAVGVVVGTVDSRAVFKELIFRRGLALAFPVAWALVRRPSLVPKVFQTFLYPSQVGTEPGESELYFVGVRGDRRGQGIGQALFQALAEESRRRGMLAMGLIADAQNEPAKRLYLRRGMREIRRFALYGRPMIWYRLELQEARDSRQAAASAGAVGGERP